MKKKPVISRNCDLADFPITRTIRQAVRNQLIPAGNFHEGPGWFNLFTLLLVHWLPCSCYRMITCFEKQALFLYRQLAGFLPASGKRGKRKSRH